MDNKRVFITGGSGVLGKSLIQNFPKEYSIFAPSSTECNILDLEKLTNTIQKYNPGILIHAAAYVNTFGCEKDLKKVQKNDKIKNQYCKKNGIKLIRIPYTMKKEEIEPYILKELGIN